MNNRCKPRPTAIDWLLLLGAAGIAMAACLPLGGCEGINIDSHNDNSTDIVSVASTNGLSQAEIDALREAGAL